MVGCPPQAVCDHIRPDCRGRGVHGHEPSQQFAASSDAAAASAFIDDGTRCKSVLRPRHGHVATGEPDAFGFEKTVRLTIEFPVRKGHEARRLARREVAYRAEQRVAHATALRRSADPEFTDLDDNLGPRHWRFRALHDARQHVADQGIVIGGDVADDVTSPQPRRVVSHAVVDTWWFEPVGPSSEIPLVNDVTELGNGARISTGRVTNLHEATLARTREREVALVARRRISRPHEGATMAFVSGIGPTWRDQRRWP